MRKGTASEGWAGWVGLRLSPFGSGRSNEHGSAKGKRTRENGGSVHWPAGEENIAVCVENGGPNQFVAFRFGLIVKP